MAERLSLTLRSDLLESFLRREMAFFDRKENSTGISTQHTVQLTFLYFYARSSSLFIYFNYITPLFLDNFDNFGYFLNIRHAHCQTRFRTPFGGHGIWQLGGAPSTGLFYSCYLTGSGVQCLLADRVGGDCRIAVEYSIGHGTVCGGVWTTVSNISMVDAFRNIYSFFIFFYFFYLSI